MVSQVHNRRLQLRQLYGFDFPEDLFRFWEFVNRLAPLEPLTALATTTGLHLVGPFEVLAGRFDGRIPAYHAHLHWRYTYDPPEFFTVFSGGTDGLHHGYYLDDPPSRTGCIASYYANDVFELEANCETLFEALRLELEQRDADWREQGVQDREQAGECAAARAALAELRGKLMRYATVERPETGAAYVERYQGVQPGRFAQVVAATREGMGIVMSPAGYRPLSLSAKQQRLLLRAKGEPTELIEEACRLLKEGYPGAALKLGKDLWAMTHERKRATAHELLDAAYASLGREVLREVLAHHHEHPHLPMVDVLHVGAE